ncbi:MAG TPA: ADOP family duplicated permease [Vicinamibacterales bacterium]|nr:ADOP family duplicated permease [Vicinamibacterales bacterium]
MADILFDLRDAWRGLRRDPLYAAAVIGTLALTLGAATAVFSIVNGVLLRPLAYPDPEALVSIREIMPGVAHRYPTLAVTPRHFDVWRTRAASFTAMAQMDWRTSTLTGVADAAQVRVLRTSGTLFDVLQTPVALGRGLTLDDERPDRPRVTVIGDALWRDRLGADPAVLGRVLTLGGTQYTIVGVLPRGSALPALATLNPSGTLSTTVDAIVPFRISLSDFDWIGQFNYGVVARLKPGVTLAQARAEMDVLQGTVAEIARRETREAAELRAWVMPLTETIVGSSRRGLLLLLGAIGGVLLIACANLANLTLTRAAARKRDVAVRGALGAARWRLVRAVIVEQLGLAAIGAAAGVGVAVLCLRVFVTTAPRALPRVQDVSIDARVLAFAGLAAGLAALAVALLPALEIGGGTLESALRAGGRTSDRGGRRARAALLSAQVALSVMLLAVSGLFVSSLTRLLRVDAGFSPEGAVTIDIAPVSARYPGIAARAALYDRIYDRVREIPGVTSAAWTSALPLTGETWVDVMVRPDRPTAGAARPSANYRFVGPEYFRAIGMPLLRGRAIDPSDRTSTVPPAVISMRASQTLWPGEDAVGREFARADPAVRYRVVGVVGDGRVTALETQSPLMVYIPYWSNNEGRSVLVVRVDGDTGAVVAAVRRAIRDIDPEVAIAAVAPLRQVVDTAVEGRRYQASLFSAFGGAALLIAVLGVYATTAYGVLRRRREINIRVALGARGRQVLGLVLRQSLAAIGGGLAVGLAGAAATGGVIASLLFEVRPRDPVVLGFVAAGVGLTGMLAAFAAARAGLRVDPAAALRDE